MSEWRPIDTAPKDGTPIWAFAKTRDVPFVVAWWNTEHGCWETRNGSAGYPISHWMPLPAPP